MIEGSNGEVYFDTCDINGYYNISTLPRDSVKYRIQASHSEFYTEKAKDVNYCDTIINFSLVRIESKGDPLPYVYYDKNSSKIKYRQKKRLSIIPKILIDNPNIGIEIVVYCDSSENKNTFSKRGQKVFQFLIKNGAGDYQLQINDSIHTNVSESYIQNQPQEKQEELRAMNRRVMFYFIRDDLEPEKKKK